MTLFKGISLEVGLCDKSQCATTMYGGLQTYLIKEKEPEIM